MIELMIGQTDGLIFDCNNVSCHVNLMYVYVLTPLICRSLPSFVVRHCTFRPTCSVLAEP